MNRKTTYSGTRETTSHVSSGPDAWMVSVHAGKAAPTSGREIVALQPETRRDLRPQGACATGVEGVTDAIVQGVSSGLAPDIAISIMNTPYDFLRVQSPMTPGKEVVLEKSLTGWSDPRTRVPYPRLTRHPNR